MKSAESLIIWLKDGQTLKFEDVKDFRIDIITFNYHGVSTNVRRNAGFNIDSIAGWAIIPPFVVFILVVMIVAYILKRHDEKKGRP